MDNEKKAVICSDWHIHSNSSYDSTLSLDEIAAAARLLGFEAVGITDHVNYNDEKFLADLKNSAESVNEFRISHPNFILGVELTPIEKPLFDHLRSGGTRENYIAPPSSTPYTIELAVSRDELISLGVSYAIGASHWRVDSADARSRTDLGECIREWYRQQLYLACDERVTILGHPWYHGKGIWYEDFSVIDRSMNEEIAAALKENGKCVECNSHFFRSRMTGEKFRRQYAEFLRELFEMGIPVTYGSDSHNQYKTSAPADVEKYLEQVGFKRGDLASITDIPLW